MDSKNLVWVIIPAYNEESVIGSVLASFTQTPYQVVVVDDGSTDRTGEVALGYPVVLLRHVTNLGQGAAIQTGISYALHNPGVQCIVTFDSDGQHDPADIERLVEPLFRGDAEVTLGTRFGAGAKVLGIPWLRKWGLYVGTWMTRISTGLMVTDTHNGMRAFTVNAARQIKITNNRMAHASDILSQIGRNHLRYREVPVTVQYSDYSLAKGQSNLEFINILWEMWTGYIK
ncbi:MAG: glycosyltransferase family 2 protein [Anaerolineaceae bacterium]|nr:glycosyltransferase family 2 protein [Anaerolineaceae bacterium]